MTELINYAFPIDIPGWLPYLTGIMCIGIGLFFWSIGAIESKILGIIFLVCGFVMIIYSPNMGYFL